VKIFEASGSKSSTDVKNYKNRSTRTAEDEIDALRLGIIYNIGKKLLRKNVSLKNVYRTKLIDYL
jgi:hypothetical protein